MTEDEKQMFVSIHCRGDWEIYEAVEALIERGVGVDLYEEIMGLMNEAKK